MPAAKKSNAKRSGSTTSRRRTSAASGRATTKGSRSTAAKKSTRSRKTASSKKSTSARKYSSKAQNKVGKVMREYKQGKLKSGGRAKVKSRKQAIAIGISEARKSGAKVPRRKKAA